MGQQDEFHRTQVRLPPDLYEALKAAAATSGRSFNAELLERLRASFGESAEVTARLDAISKQLARLERKVGK